MALGLAQLGAQNADTINLGRGQFYARKLLSTNLLHPEGYRFLGNTTALTLEPTVEEFTRKNYTQSLVVIDKRIPLSTELALNFATDELSQENLVEWSLGDTSTEVMPFATDQTAVVLSTALVKGFTYPTLSSGGVHMAGFKGTKIAPGTPAAGEYSILVVMGDGVANPALGTPVTLTEGTDYTFDARRGLIRILPGGAAVAGRPLAWTYDVNASSTIATTTTQVVRGLKRSRWTAAFMFIGENPADNDRLWILKIHKASVTPSDAFNAIGDEATSLGFTGAVERNEAVGGVGSPWYDFRAWNQE